MQVDAAAVDCSTQNSQEQNTADVDDSGRASSTHDDVAESSANGNDKSNIDTMELTSPDNHLMV